MSMNHVVLVGRLGVDPELRSTQGGKTMCRLRLATDGTRKEGEEAKPDWHDVVVWDRQAELCAQYLAKGKLKQMGGGVIARNIQPLLRVNYRLNLITYS